MNRKDYLNPNAESIPFDPGTTDLVETEVGPAIRELAATVGVSASPGFQFGRSGNVSTNTYLNVVGNVPSNKAGITVALTNPIITQIFIAGEDLDTYDIEIYEHEGNEINITLLGSVSVVAARSATFSVSFNVTSGRQLATFLTNGSGKNINVGLQLQGST